MNCPGCGASLEFNVDSDDEGTRITLSPLDTVDRTKNGTQTSERRPAPAEPSELQIPGFVLGRPIGQGGMGTVWEARQESLGGRRVAIKVLSSRLSRNTEFVQRFQQEAHMLAKLSHPNIVNVNDFGADGDLCYIVMEFVEGAREGQPETVRDQINQKLVTADLAKKWIVQVVEALAEAHRNGIVHRDIKPSNVLIDRFGNAKVADFGIASQRQPNRRGLTRDGGVLGTDQYMPPEQALDSSSVTERADIFACGVMLYEMLSGILPDKHNPPLSRMIPDLDPQWDAVVARAMQPEPAHRFGSAVELRDAIMAIATSAAETSVGAVGEPLPPPLPKPAAVPLPARPAEESTSTGTFVDQTCFACGEPVSADSQFCQECGVSLLSKCPRCEADLRGGPKYCPGCGFEAQKWQKYVHSRDQAERELQQAQQEQLAAETRFQHSEQALLLMTRAIRYHADDRHGLELLNQARTLSAQLAGSLAETAHQRGNWSEAREYFSFVLDNADDDPTARDRLQSIDNWRHQTVSQLQALLAAGSFGKAEQQLQQLQQQLPEDPEIAELERQLASRQATLTDAQQRLKTLIAEKRLFELQQLIDDCRANGIGVPDKLAATVATQLSSTVPEWLQSIETLMLQEDYAAAFDTAGRLLVICSDCAKAKKLRDQAKAAINKGRIQDKHARRRNLIVAATLIVLAGIVGYATHSSWLPAVKSLLVAKAPEETPLETPEDPLGPTREPAHVPTEGPKIPDTPQVPVEIEPETPAPSAAIVDLKGGADVDLLEVGNDDQQLLRVTFRGGEERVVKFSQLNTRDQDYVKARLNRGGDGERRVLPGTVAERETGKKWALLVGVNDYQNLQDLEFCSRDVSRLRERFVNLGFPAENILLLSSESSSESAPTKPNIEAALDRLLSGRIRSGEKGVTIEPRLVGREDMIVVAFSGHGVSQDGESFFCAAEAEVKRPRETMVSMEDVYSRLAAVPNGVRLLFVDACRNTPAKIVDAAPASATTAFKLLNVPHGIYALSSCSPGETSMEHPPLKHGVFTYYLQGALGGAGSERNEDDDVEIRLSQLAGFTIDHTVGYARNVLERTQTPELMALLQGNPLIGKLSRLDAVGDDDLVPTYKPGEIAGEYELNLNDVEVPLMPEGWRHELNVITAYTANGTPRVKVGGDTSQTITSPTIEMRGDFFLEFEASTKSADFSLQFIGSDNNGKADAFDIKLNYSSFNGGLRLTLPDLKPRYFFLGHPEKDATVLFRIERRGRRYTFIVNSDESEATQFIRTYPSHGDFRRLQLTLDTQISIYDLRVGPLSEERKLSEATSQYRVRIPRGVLPEGWSFVGNPLPLPTVYRVRSAPGVIKANGDFLLLMLAKTEGNAHYTLSLLGDHGGRTLPLHFEHASYSRSALVSFPMSKSQSFAAAPEKPFLLILMRRHSKGGRDGVFQFSLCEQDANPDFKHAINGGAFADFGGLQIDVLASKLEIGAVLLRPMKDGETFDEAFENAADDESSPKQWLNEVINGQPPRPKR